LPKLEKEHTAKYTKQKISVQVRCTDRLKRDIIIDEYQHMHFFTFNTVLV